MAKKILLKIQKEFSFSLTEVDIEKNKPIFEKYKELIPVIEIEEEIFYYKVDEDKLKQILKIKSQPR